LTTSEFGDVRVSVTTQTVFGERSKAAALHREATVLKDAGDWNGAVAKLMEAKEVMLHDNHVHTSDSWCRLAKFLQYAGRYDESMREFDFLLGDLERRARVAYHLDNPAISYGKESKKKLARASIRRNKSVINQEREIVKAREARKIRKETT
jgi:hypothetical protein